MRVSVRYLAQLKQAAGRSAEQVPLSGPGSVADLLVLLTQLHPALQRVLLDSGGRVQPTLLIFVGDEQAEHDRMLLDGDDVTLMTPIAGGEAPWQPSNR
jgi:molybdopterin converting factor small subunit